MTELLYQYDSYLKEFTAKVLDIIEGMYVILDRTAFHPKTGGLESDTGYIIKGDIRYTVVEVLLEKYSSRVLHKIQVPIENLKVDDEVIGVINWERRYRIMRLHTASHIIAAIMYTKYNALITGGNITPEYAYDDYSLETFDKKVFEDAIAEANSIVKRGIEVKIYWLNREEAMKIPGIVKLASRMPPSVSRLRIVEIPGIDIQADGGPHVRNTSEIGEIMLIKAENKGKNRKRLYFTVKP
ncbi:MAG: alanyl-tRNA editing protein [Desulfurococcaceae archaeon]|nr:alanyl-tRNA editing protein [Desulfurococcaceae archaeon]